MSKITKSSNDKTWEEFYRIHLKFVSEHRDLICPEYTQFLSNVGWSPIKLPTVSELNASIRSSGWTLTSVPGFEAPYRIFTLLSQQTLMIAESMRNLDQIEYSPQPDLIHDLMGHVPLVFHTELMDFTKCLATKAVTLAPSSLDERLYQANHTFSSLVAAGEGTASQLADVRQTILDLSEESLKAPSPFTCIAHLYLWIVEFGIQSSRGNPKVFGAGLLSSRREFNNFSKGLVNILPVSPIIFQTGVQISDFQPQLFVMNDFDEAFRLLEEI